ncbi:MAG: substrate-binding periplasmic protein [Eggerthellaceae bacterium]|jgi:polar amino acid transport system substrate-binding protein
MKHPVKAVLALCAVFAMVFALSGCSSDSYTPSLKESTIDQTALVSEGTLTVGVDASNAPFAYQQDGKIVGIDVDVAAALADEMGLKLQIVDVGTDPNSALKKGQVDIVMSVKKTDTSVDAWLSDSYLSTSTALFATDENTDLPSTTKSTTIAAQTSSVSANLVINQYGTDYLSSVSDLSTAFSNLESGTVKYVAADAVIGTYLVNQSHYSAKIIGLMQKPTGYCIGVSSSNTALKTEVANGLANISDQGIISVIEQKWLGSALDLDSYQLTDGASSSPASASSSGSGETISATDTSSSSSTSSESGSSSSSSVSNVGANAAKVE